VLEVAFRTALADDLDGPQPYVQHRDVGPGGRNSYHRGGCRTGLADHLDGVLDRQTLVDAPPDDLVVGSGNNRIFTSSRMYAL